MANNTNDPILDVSSMDIFRRILGDKWKFFAILHLFNGPKRFGELRYSLDSITQKVLTENLRELERVGVIYRTIYSSASPRVEYALTPLGEALRPTFLSSISWCLEYAQEYREGRITGVVSDPDEASSAQT